MSYIPVIDSSRIQDDTILDADVNSAAAIAVTKLALGASDTVLQSDGVTNSFSTTTGANARLAVSKNSGATVGTRRRLNLIEGTNVTLTIADDAGNEEVDVTIDASFAADPPLELSGVKTANYTQLAADDVIEVDTSGGAFTVTLLPAATAGAGARVWIKDVAGACATNALTVDGDTAETIDGAATQSLNKNYMAFHLYTDGTAWFIL